MSKSGTIIIVDDNKGVLTAIQILFKKLFLKGRCTLLACHPDGASYRRKIPEVVLLDMNFTSGINTGNEGLFWLHEIKKYVQDL